MKRRAAKQKRPHPLPIAPTRSRAARPNRSPGSGLARLLAQIQSYMKIHAAGLVPFLNMPR